MTKTWFCRISIQEGGQGLLATLGYFPGRRPLQKFGKPHVYLIILFLLESLEALKKYYVIGASVPSLHRVYRLSIGNLYRLYVVI